MFIKSIQRQQQNEDSYIQGKTTNAIMKLFKFVLKLLFGFGSYF